MKFVSLIICHFGQTDPANADDRNADFRLSLKSLKENTDYPVEVIVVDNGGNPDDTEYLTELARRGDITILIRNHNNMSFAFAWNQGVRLATGDYLAFSCNDIYYGPGWLSKCVQMLEENPDRKLIASPYLTPDKLTSRWMRGELGGNRLNTLAGSNCMVMRHESFLDIGEFPHHRVGGSTWHRVMHTKGYLVILPPEDMASHLRFRKGVNWRNDVKVERTLLRGEKVNYNYVPYRKSLYYGTQKPAGIKIQKQT